MDISLAGSSLVVEQSSGLGECFERIAFQKRYIRPLCTYRFQFNRNFRFTDAHRLVPYLRTLGISHCYASPILKARSGSAHGYDIIDHNELNPEIGSEEEFRALCYELKTHGMALVVDIVPNHMGVGHGNNPWWQDVLQNGQTSVYAEYFDIDWEPLKPELRGKVLTPVLGSQYGAELESGRIRVAFEEGRFVVKYFGTILPIDPQTLPLLFESAGPEGVLQLRNEDPELQKFSSLLEACRLLPPHRVGDAERINRRRQEVPILLAKLRELAESSASIRHAIDEAIRNINGTPGDPHSFDALHRLLEAQVYRLAFWRVSGEEINYRRFFDINDLVGLRMEDPRVFAATHKLLRKLLAKGMISGLRLDHPDGLLNPAQYFTQLQMLFAASQCCGQEPVLPVSENGIEVEVQRAFDRHDWRNQTAPLYVAVEKILEPDEALPANWPVDGTVGYDFTNLVNGVFIDRRNERYFTNLYHRIIGDEVDLEMLIYNSKKLVINTSLSSELNVLSHMLEQISSQDRYARDITRNVLRGCIRETIACFPVYRTYIDERGRVDERDRHYIKAAIECAKRRNAYMAPAVFDFLQSILLLELPESDSMVYGFRRQLYFTLKFQQLTGPVMAKGLEDTACYVYSRFISLNEVGGSPADFGTPIAQFHSANRVRAERWTHSMLTSSTHDTKRSEDVRARLDVLSEMPRIWSAQVMKWRRLNRQRKLELSDGRVAPDANEEYFLYQTLVGTWPLELANIPGRNAATQNVDSLTSTHHEEVRQQFVSRIRQYMEKAVHEAKVNASWVNPNPEYTSAVNEFIEKILSPLIRGRSNYFLETFLKFLPPVLYFGAINSLSQTLLKLTSPGVPDIYQGQELWDFSLVDPDNRRPVDFESRQHAIGELKPYADSNDSHRLQSLCHELLHEWTDGRIKMWVTMQALRLRAEKKELFQSQSYTPLTVAGPKEEHAIAFARHDQNHTIIVVVPRLAYTLMKGTEAPPLSEAWSDTVVALPEGCELDHFRNVFDGSTVTASGARGLLCRELFAHFPLALLTTP